ncbi:hypothetical protein B5780_1414 [Bifidobacterium longum]|nr:hypothetical protein B5780_1414 [Bifidobacterium longum]
MLRSVLAGMLSPRHCPRGIAVGAWRSVGDEFDMVFMRREWPAMPPAGRHVRPWLPPESRAARDRQAEGRQTQSQTVEAHERVPEPARPEGQAQGPARILGEHLQHAAARDRENRPQEPRRPGRRPRTHLRGRAHGLPQRHEGRKERQRHLGWPSASTGAAGTWRWSTSRWATAC